MLSGLFSVVTFSSTFSMELINAHSVSSPEPVQLFSNHRDLFVQDENAAYRVEKHNMNPLLHEVMKRKAMGEFTEKGGYLRVKQLSDGKYLLAAQVRGEGGTGAITAGIVYFGVQYLGCLGIIGGTVAVNAMAPGAGGVVTTMALGSGGIVGATAAIQAAAVNAAVWTLALPIPLP